MKNKNKSNHQEIEKILSNFNYSCCFETQKIKIQMFAKALTTAKPKK